MRGSNMRTAQNAVTSVTINLHAFVNKPRQKKIARVKTRIYERPLTFCLFPNILCLQLNRSTK